METEFKEIIYRNTIIKVSDNGDVIWNGTKRNTYLNHDGYLQCSIKITDVGWRSVGVHILVAMAFVPNPNNLPEVNHKDYNRANPCANNLEWVTHFDNIQYSKCNLPDYTGDKNPNYGNKKLSKIYKENPLYSKEKQGRPGLQNGRCRKIKIYYDGVLEKEFEYILECCKYIQEKYCPNVNIESIRGRINDSIRKNKPYKKHLTFVKE